MGRDGGLLCIYTLKKCKKGVEGGGSKDKTNKEKKTPNEA